MTHLARPRRAMTAAVASIAVLIATLTGLAGTASATIGDPPPYPGHPRYYVALGDSFSSGTGAAASGETYTDTACRRSRTSYPARFQAAQTANLVLRNMTCHGARVADIISNQIPAIITNTKIITVTGGGNNPIATVNGGSQRLGFSGILTACITPSLNDCAVALDVTASRQALSRLYTTIKSQIQATNATFPPSVYVLAYPRIFSNAGCTGISAAEAQTLNVITNNFNELIRQEVAKAGFTFVDTRGSFTGHESCATNDWVHNVESDVEESYHPTPRGHQALFERLSTTIFG